MNEMRFGLITGIPRSGTTLAAAIVDQFDGAFCLSEPDEHVSISLKVDTNIGFVRALVHAMEESHSALARGDTVSTRRAADGASITNYFEPGATHRKVVARTLCVGKAGLPPDFRLCAKHNALYTAVLPELVASQAFEIVAIIRDPLSVIGSWRSLSLPISFGRLPAGERFWRELREITQSNEPLLHKQGLIYELFCRRYLDLRDDINVIRYADVLADPAILPRRLGIHTTPVALERVKAMISRPAHIRDPEVAEVLSLLATENCLPATMRFFPEIFDQL